MLKPLLLDFEDGLEGGVLLPQLSSQSAKYFVFGITGQLGNATWTKTGDQSNDWKSALVFFSQNTPTQAQVVFEGVMTTGFSGDMALDDISFNDGHCPPTISCDFEDSNLCGYTQDTTDQFDWTRMSGHTSSTGTGPDNDHTYGTAAGERFLTESRGSGNSSVVRAPDW